MIYGRRPRAGYTIQDKQTGRQEWVPPVGTPTGRGRPKMDDRTEYIKLYTLLMLIAVHALVAINACHTLTVR